MSRLDKLKEQHPELNVPLIDMLVKVDPTKTYKYTEFLIKMVKHYFADNDAPDIGLNIAIEILGTENVELLNEFETHSKANRIENKDISSYKNWLEIKESVDDAKEVLRLKELEKQVNKLYEDDEWLVVIPLSFEASKSYGSSTKWCTTQEQHWRSYYKEYKLIYIINKLSNEKYAISREKEKDYNIQAWLSNDDETSPLLIPIPKEIMSILIDELRKNESIDDLIEPETTEVRYDDMTLEIIKKYIGGGGYSTYGITNVYGATYDDSNLKSFTNYGDYLIKKLLNNNDNM